MKFYKKALAGILAAATITATAVPAFADTETDANSDRQTTEFQFPDRLGSEASDVRPDALICHDPDGSTVYYQWCNGHGIPGCLPFKVTAYVNADGTSGKIYIDENCPMTDYTIDRIGYTKLSDIVKFKDGSSVDSITVGEAESPYSICYDRQVNIHTVNSNVLNWEKAIVTDNDGETHDTNIVFPGSHVVGYNSNDPGVRVIEWQS